MDVDLEQIRQNLSLQNTRDQMADGVQEVLRVGKRAVPLFPEVFAVMKALYASADQFGDDARQLEGALYAVQTLLPEAELTDGQIGTLSHLAHNRRSFPNAADMAVEALRLKGLAPRSPAPKPTAETRAAARLAKAREDLRSKDFTRLLSATVSLDKMKPDELRAIDELLGEVQDALRVCIAERAAGGDVNFYIPAGLLKAAKALLPSPRAERALYETYKDSPTPQLKTRARACLKLIDG